MSVVSGGEPPSPAAPTRHKQRASTALLLVLVALFVGTTAMAATMPYCCSMAVIDINKNQKTMMAPPPSRLRRQTNEEAIAAESILPQDYSDTSHNRPGETETETDDDDDDNSVMSTAALLSILLVAISGTIVCCTAFVYIHDLVKLVQNRQRPRLPQKAPPHLPPLHLHPPPVLATAVAVVDTSNHTTTDDEYLHYLNGNESEDALFTIFPSDDQSTSHMSSMTGSIRSTVARHHHHLDRQDEEDEQDKLCDDKVHCEDNADNRIQRDSTSDNGGSHALNTINDRIVAIEFHLDDDPLMENDEVDRNASVEAMVTFSSSIASDEEEEARYKEDNCDIFVEETTRTNEPFHKVSSQSSLEEQFSRNQAQEQGHDHSLSSNLSISHIRLTTDEEEHETRSTGVHGDTEKPTMISLMTGHFGEPTTPQEEEERDALPSRESDKSLRSGVDEPVLLLPHDNNSSSTDSDDHQTTDYNIRDIYFVPGRQSFSLEESTMDVAVTTCCLGLVVQGAYPCILRISPDSPLESRVFVGDVILSINDNDAAGLKAEQVYAIIRHADFKNDNTGVGGTIVTLVKLTVLSSQSDGNSDSSVATMTTTTTTIDAENAILSSASKRATAVFGLGDSVMEV